MQVVELFWMHCVAKHCGFRGVDGGGGDGRGGKDHAVLTLHSLHVWSYLPSCGRWLLCNTQCLFIMTDNVCKWFHWSVYEDNQSNQGQHLLVKTHDFTEADWPPQQSHDNIISIFYKCLFNDCYVTYTMDCGSLSARGRRESSHVIGVFSHIYLTSSLPPPLASYPNWNWRKRRWVRRISYNDKYSGIKIHCTYCYTIEHK